MKTEALRLAFLVTLLSVEPAMAQEQLPEIQVTPVERGRILYGNTSLTNRNPVE